MLDDELNNENDILNMGNTSDDTTSKPKKNKAKAEDTATSTFDTFDSVAALSAELQADNSEPVTVQPVQFASFDASTQTQGQENQNLELLMDVKLQLTVELGRCELPIKKVLELTRGSIVELDRVAGEPVDLFANGKHVANGEVVVIDDNFGLRITNICEPEERMKSLQ